MEFLNTIVTIIIVIGAGFFAYMSSVLVSEKKQRQQAGITDYYDQPIKKKKDNGN